MIDMTRNLTDGLARERRIERRGCLGWVGRWTVSLMLVVAAFLAIPGPAVPDFASPVNFDVGSAPRSVQVADLRGNGIRDLVTANFGNDSISVVLGNGDGTFQPALN